MASLEREEVVRVRARALIPAVRRMEQQNGKNATQDQYGVSVEFVSQLNEVGLESTTIQEGSPTQTLFALASPGWLLHSFLEPAHALFSLPLSLDHLKIP